MTSKVFISYRREDTKWQAREIYRSLTQWLPREHVFMDVDSIPPGADFISILEGWVDQCNAVLVLIGPNWVDAIDSKTGRRRLENPNDFVRTEIRKGLTRGIPVVPVLVDGAEIPRREELPSDLQALVRRNAEFVELRTVDADVERLAQRLGLERKAYRSVQRSSGTLVVKSSVSALWSLAADTMLFVDDNVIGAIPNNTTKQFDLPLGRIKLKVVAGGFESKRLEVEIVPGAQTLVEIQTGWFGPILKKSG